MKAIYLWQQPKKRVPQKSKIKLLIQDIAKFAELSISDGAILSFTFLSTEEMIKMNNHFLNHDYLTDVICFNYGENGDVIEVDDIAIEIFISPDIALERADEDSSLSYSSEIVLYMVHGVLHATGLLDSTKEEKVIMRNHESTIMKNLKQKYNFDEIFPI